ncbi:hypothetical protein, partial [Caldimonas sp.]|uniref:hypothetical protein n=1 Tax=Caldimonas sp. TaxID=2838790 RepID=UPI003918B6ED
PGHVEALCLAAIEEMRMGFARWCVALMAVSLIRHLDRHGVHAIRLAPPVNHYGQRYLCLIDLDAMEGAA